MFHFGEPDVSENSKVYKALLAGISWIIVNSGMYVNKHVNFPVSLANSVGISERHLSVNMSGSIMGRAHLWAPLPPGLNRPNTHNGTTNASANGAQVITTSAEC